MIEVNNNYKCCGYREIHGLGFYRSPQKALLDLLKGQMGGCQNIADLGVRVARFRYVMFAQAASHKMEKSYGDRFKAFLLHNKLGTVIETDWNINPNSYNQLKIFIWTIDWTTTRAWAEKHLTFDPIKPIPRVNTYDVAPGQPAVIVVNAQQRAVYEQLAAGEHQS